MANLVQFPGLGLQFTIDRVMATIAGYPIYWYGAIIAFGICCALAFIFANTRNFGLDEDRTTDVLILAILCGIIGARVYYVIFAPFKYESLWEMVNIRDGGLGIYGGILAGFGSGILFCKWKKQPVLQLFDVTALGFLIGQCIGRWGNFFNQEAFGTNTTLPWGMYSSATNAYLSRVQSTLAAQGVVVDPSMPVHPTFLYESLWCLLGFVLLALHIKKRQFNGELLLMYIMWYGAGRFFIESLRTDSLMTPFFGLRVSQIVALTSVVGGAVAWFILYKKNKGKQLQLVYTTSVTGKDGPMTVTVTWPSKEVPTKEKLKEMVAAAAQKDAASAQDATTVNDEVTVFEIKEEKEADDTPKEK